MNPVLGATKVDKLLTQFSIAYRNGQYISDRIMPTLKVKERTGKFAKYGKDNLRLEDFIDRAPGARARSFDYTVSQGSYVCTEKALEKIVPDELVLNSDDPYDPMRDATMFCVDKIWLHQENALAGTMADTSVITQNTTLSGTDQWSDFANSDPFDDITTARNTIKQNTAMHPNVAVFGYQTWEKFIHHPDVVDRIKYVGMIDMNSVKRAVAQLLEVEEVLVGDAVKNSANEGQTDSLGYVWGKHFWLLVRPSRPGLMTASFGYTIKDMDRVVDRYREDSRVGDVVRVRDSYDQTLVDDTLAYLIKNAVA
jgi:hypothetical protein